MSIGIHAGQERLSDLVFEVDRGIEKRHFGVDGFADQFPFAGMEELAHF